MHTYAEPPVTFVRGEGSDALRHRRAREYLDFLVRPGRDLARPRPSRRWPRPWPARPAPSATSPTCSATTVGPEVAVTLDRLIGGGTERAGGQVFFANSGAEANECALKLARRWAGPGRSRGHHRDDSFHGRTLATLAATGQPEKHAPFLPLPEGFDHVPYDDLDAMDAACDPTRWPPSWSSRILGEAGVVVPSSDYLGAVRAAVHRAGHPAHGRRGPDRARAAPGAGSPSSTSGSSPTW